MNKTSTMVGLLLLSASLVGGCAGGNSGAMKGPVSGGSVGGEQLCKAPNSGARTAYHTPDPGDTWLMDCHPRLKREYWRAFEQSSGNAYLIPRPETDPRMKELCEGGAGESLATMLEGYTYCDERSDVDRINAMQPKDARALVKALHERLKFEPDAGSIAPYPMWDDIADACDQHADLQSGSLKSICVTAHNPPSEELPEGFSDQDAQQIASMLNQLYGIKG